MTSLLRTGQIVAVLGALTLGLSGHAAETSPAEPSPDKAAPSALDAEIQRLIAQLGDDDYFVRERAQAELEQIGFDAFDALSAAASHEDLEIATRAKSLLRRMRVDMSAKDDSAEVKKLLADYENQPREQKLARMRALADLPDGAGLAALGRLVRYEKTSLMSKQAAVALLGRPGQKRPPEGPPADALRSSLERSSRPAARWILTWLRSSADPKAAMEQWGQHVDAERQLLQAAPHETSPEIVAALIRYQIEWLKQQNESEKAMAAMRQLLDLEQGDPDTLVELMQWLIEQRAWKLIDELAQRFKTQFQENPVLLYALAQAQAAQGDKEQSEKTAAEALKLRPGQGLESLIEHLRTAIQLRHRGMVEWSIREYRHVIQTSPEGHPIAINARFGLSELYHDQDRNLEAGQELEAALKYAALPPGVPKRPLEATLAGRSVDEVTSRMHYFFACHHAAKQQLKEQKERLLKGLDVESPDIDLLIAARQVGDFSDEQRKTLEAKIKRAAEEVQQEINQDPSNAVNYNQYAWLVGNTSRSDNELDQALKYSQRSLELSPDNGGYYDTLAHIYAAKGDYENAVRAQTKAAELEPHSGQIARKLKLFKSKLAEK